MVGEPRKVPVGANAIHHTPNALPGNLARSVVRYVGLAQILSGIDVLGYRLPMPGFEWEREHAPGTPRQRGLATTDGNGQLSALCDVAVDPKRLQ